MMSPFGPLLLLAITLCAGYLKAADNPADRDAPLATDKRSAPEVTISITPRKATFKLKDPVYCDIVVTNPSDTAVTIPFLYNCIIEIDGSLYTQFPKPMLFDKDGKVITGMVFEPHSETPYGPLCLGDGLETLDAATGRVPLTLVAGSHSLVLLCGAYRSNRIEFTLKE